MGGHAPAQGLHQRVHHWGQRPRSDRPTAAGQLPCLSPHAAVTSSALRLLALLRAAARCSWAQPRNILHRLRRQALLTRAHACSLQALRQTRALRQTQGHTFETSSYAAGTTADTGPHLRDQQLHAACHALFRACKLARQLQADVLRCRQRGPAGAAVMLLSIPRSAPCKCQVHPVNVKYTL